MRKPIALERFQALLAELQSKPESFQQQLHAVRDGRMPFAKFVRESGKTWRALARYLMNRWQPPVAVDLEDLTQQLLFACWRFLPKWDPARGTKLVDFIVYNCTDKAKKWLHRQRNAYRRDGKSPSRIEAPLSTLGLEEHAEERLMSRVSVEGNQEQELIYREALRSVPSSDLLFLCYKQSLDVRTAAERVFQNPTARLAFGLDSLAASCAAIERSIENAAAGAA